MFSSFLHPVVCRKARVVFTLFVFVSVVSNTYCIVYLFCFSLFGRDGMVVGATAIYGIRDYHH